MPEEEMMPENAPITCRPFVQKSRKTVTCRMLQVSKLIEEAFRILGMTLVLSPAAFLLPKRLALIISKLLALPLLILPSPGFELYWKMRKVFGKRRADSVRLAWDYLSRIYRDFIVIKRLQYKKENPFNWKIVERNVDAINELRKSGESYIVATGHFAREGLFSLMSPAVTPGHIVSLTLAPPSRIHSLYDLRIRIQFGVWQIPDFAGWGREHEAVFRGNDPLPFRRLYHLLRSDGNVIFIHVDAGWNRAKVGAYERPFAGHKNRVFATGAAQLARLTRRPMVGCVYIVEDDGRIVLEWGSPIRSSEKDDRTEIDLMNHVVDQLEIAVGERPTQYVLDIGGDRRWNSSQKTWESFNRAL
jgi:lauroyl/myristoyl acyltransferase